MSWEERCSGKWLFRIGVANMLTSITQLIRFMWKRNHIDGLEEAMNYSWLTSCPINFNQVILESQSEIDGLSQQILTTKFHWCRYFAQVFRCRSCESAPFTQEKDSGSSPLAEKAGEPGGGFYVSVQTERESPHFTHFPAQNLRLLMLQLLIRDHCCLPADNRVCIMNNSLRTGCPSYLNLRWTGTPFHISFPPLSPPTLPISPHHLSLSVIINHQPLCGIYYLSGTHRYVTGKHVRERTMGFQHTPWGGLQSGC